MTNLEAVIFDLGDVVIPWNPRMLYRKLFTDEAAMEHFLATVCTSAWNLRQDEGRSLEEGTRELVETHPGQEAMIRAFYGRWEEMLGEAIPGTVRLIADLKAAGYRVLALSNWSAETFPVIRHRYPVLDEFEGIVISGEVKVAKPDPAIYRVLFERHGVVPERSIFLDDNPDNVEGSRRVGMEAIRFREPGQAREELRALGVRV